MTINFHMDDGELTAVTYEPAETNGDHLDKLQDDHDKLGEHLRSMTLTVQESGRRIAEAWEEAREAHTTEPATTQLTPAERQTLSMRMWHPDRHSGYTLEELSTMWEVTKEHIKEIEDSAMRKIAAVAPKSEG